MYKVVTKGAELEVWGRGFYSKERAEAKVKSGYFHRYMYQKDKHKTLIVVPEVSGR